MGEEDYEKDELHEFFKETRIYLSKLGKNILKAEPEIWENEKYWSSLIRDSVFIIVGAWEGSELFDRLGAYKIAEKLEEQGISGLVMTDIWWEKVADMHEYGNSPVITVGGPRANSFSDKVAKKLGLGDEAIGFRKLERQLVGYAWGRTARDTLVAVKTFIETHLMQFIEETKTRDKVPEFPEELLAKYEPIEFLGEGGFAKVFKVRRKTDGKTIALKVLTKEKRVTDTLTNEVAAWLSLDHENIAKLYGVSKDPVPHMEVELAEGVKIGDKVVRDLGYLPKPLDEKMTIRLIRGLPRD